MNVIIFSKDRACQLDLLLRSMPEGLHPIIIYTASTPQFSDGYDKVNGILIYENDFKSDLLRTIDISDPHIMFLTDDDVFINPFPEQSPQMTEFIKSSHIACLSLRLNPDLRYCYTLNRAMRKPNIKKLNTWEWMRADADFGYPMSLDGHIFRTSDILPLLQTLDYYNPNTLEGQLARHPINRPKMMCFDKSIIVNNPVNRVQSTVANRHGNITAEYLNEQWLAGRRIKLEPFMGVKNNACHVELPIEFE